MKKQIQAAAERRKKQKIKFSLFSFHWIAALFISSGISILYTLTVYRRLADYLETTDSRVLEFWAGLGTFLFLSLLFTVVGSVSRKITMKDPIMKILQATERIGAGDFSVRLPERVTRTSSVQEPSDRGRKEAVRRFSPFLHQEPFFPSWERR